MIHRCHTFHPSILRAYDVRGIYGETLFEIDAYALGYCFGRYVKEHTSLNSIALGYDGRASSPSLAISFMQGLAAADVSVQNVGAVPTPALYFAIQNLDKVGGGVMITGSHNPKDHNGFKLALKDRPVAGDEIKGFQNQDIPDVSLIPQVNEMDILTPYIDKIASVVQDIHPLKIVWDTGNGIVGGMLQKLLQHVPGEHIIINEVVDATFPNHHPDPSDPTTMVQLREEVLRTEADLGFAFDGDGDRLGMVDETGCIWTSEDLMMLFASDILQNLPHALLLADVSIGQGFFDHVASLGGQSKRVKTGHSSIKIMLKELNADFAGEQSGHFFFKDNYYGYDDALYAAMRALRVAGTGPTSLQGLHMRFPRYVPMESRVIHFSTSAEKKAAMERLKGYLDKAGTVYDPLDGFRIQTEDGWFLIRASNTEEKIVIRGEAKCSSGLERIEGQVSQIVQAGL